MKKLLLQFIVFFGLSLIYVYSIAQGNWEYYGSTKDNYENFYYDKTSISYLTKDTVRVWTKTVVNNEKSILETIKMREKHKLPIKGYDKYKEIKFLTEIKCSTKEYRNITYIQYDTDGIVLDSVGTDNPRWSFIIPDSEIALLHKTVCQKTRQ